MLQTGKVDAILVAGQGYDSEPAEKDVSSITCWVDPNDSKTLIVKITNAYPSIDYWQLFAIHNAGTIPVKVESITFDTAGMPANSTVEITNLAVGEQIEPDKTKSCTLHVHLENDAEEQATYTFTVTIVVTQWNEVP